MINRVYGSEMVGKFALAARDGVTLIDGKVFGAAAVAMLHPRDRATMKRPDPVLSMNDLRPTSAL